LSFCLPVRACRITYAEDQKIADAGTFTLLKEDHTLGNIIRMSLLADGRVLFAGYRMPHPLENRMLIKIKTRPGYKSEWKNKQKQKQQQQQQ
jgi:DNA-directed RNA polymerase II subunit RPB11